MRRRLGMGVMLALLTATAVLAQARSADAFCVWVCSCDYWWCDW